MTTRELYLKRLKKMQEAAKNIKPVDSSKVELTMERTQERHLAVNK